MNKWFILLVCSVLLLYFQTFDNPLIFDSQALVLAKPESWSWFESIKWWIEYLFTQATTFDINLNRAFLKDTFEFLTRQFGLGVYGHNVVNVLIHLLNSLLFCVFLQSFYSKSTSRLTSLFFAVNPASIYAVAYLIQRSQLLMLFFGLLQCILYIRALDKRTWFAPLYFALSLLSFKFACMSKESGVVLIAMFPLLSLAYREWARSMVFLSVVVLAGTALYTSVRGRITFGVEYYGDVIEATCFGLTSKADAYYHSVLTQSGLFFRYFAQWVFPFDSSIDMRFELQRTILPVVFFVLYAFASFILLLRKGTRFLGLGLLAAAVFFLPELSRVRLGEMFVLYRSYLWSLSYMIAVGWIVERYALKRSFVVIIALMALISWKQLGQFDSETKAWAKASSLIGQTSEVACQGTRAFNNMGQAQLINGDVFGAIKSFKTASELNPVWLLPVSNLASSYYLVGDFDSAKPLVDRVIDEYPLSPLNEISIGMLENAKSISAQIKNY